MRDLQAVALDALSRTGQRVSIGEGSSWGSLNIPTLFPSLVSQADAGALSFFVSEIAETVTPAAPVAAGSPKPVGVTVSTTSKTIGKHAGMASLTLEDFLQAESIIGGISDTLAAQAVISLDTSAVAALDAAVAAPVAAPTWVEAISAGQAAVNSKGGRPDLLVVPSVDWPSLASEIAGSAGLSTASGSAILDVLGSRVILSPKAPTGASYVVDPDSCVTVLRDVGVIVDALSGADTNTLRVVVDLVAATYVARPAGVAAISVGP